MPEGRRGCASVSATWIVAAAAACVVACGPSGRAAVPPAPPLQASPGPLLELGPCSSPPPATAGGADGHGTTLPPGAVVTDVRREGGQTNVFGYVPMTPSQVRYFYETSSLLRITIFEDETVDAELDMTDGRTRTFLRLVARCELGSDFIAIVSDEVAPAGGG